MSPEFLGWFNPKCDINWFRAIGGNQSGIVSVWHFPIIRLATEYEELAADLDGSRDALFWCKKSEYNDNIDGFYKIPLFWLK